MGIKLTFGPCDINVITAYIQTSVHSSTASAIKSKVSILTTGYYITLSTLLIFKGNRHKLDSFLFLIIFFFLNFWLCWVFVAVRRLYLVAVSRGCSSLWCVGFSLQWLLLLQSMGSRRAGFSSCGSRALERRLSSCSAACGIFPDEGSNPCPLHLAGGFLTTVPPGKSTN